MTRPKRKDENDIIADKNKRRIPEPVPSKQKPTCPKDLDKVGKAKWIETVNRLEEMGLLTDSDADVIEIYCFAWSRYKKYEAFIEEHGENYKLENGYLQAYDQKHDMYKNLAIVQKLQTELGLSPGARTKLSIQKKSTATKWGNFFEHP